MYSESNKRMVTFMDIKPHASSRDVYSWSDAPFFYVSENNLEKVMTAICGYVKYNSSWEWLMPVVHKCLKICHENMLNEWENSFADKFLSCDIKMMYKEADEFIQWWEQNEKYS